KSVRILRLPTLAARGDLADLVAPISGDTEALVRLRADVLALTEAALFERPDTSGDGDATRAGSSANEGSVAFATHLALPYRPFPLEPLPAIVREYAVAVATGMDADPAQVIAPMLSALAGAVGNAARI